VPGVISGLEPSYYTLGMLGFSKRHPPEMDLLDAAAGFPVQRSHG